jgi:integrase/recombinase XerD
MARGGMRISEVLGLKPTDIDGQKLLLHTPKSGREQEIVFIPKKLSNRLLDYVRNKPVSFDQHIFPITYAGARKMVVKVGNMVGIKLRPHDLRRHAATYASRSGVPLEIVSKVILRYADLSTTQRYLGKVSNYEAIRWVESLHGWFSVFCRDCYYVLSRITFARPSYKILRIGNTNLHYVTVRYSCDIGHRPWYKIEHLFILR